MLIGINPIIGPELLSILHRMGHGDRLVLADAHFPGETYAKQTLRADGIRIADLLEGILPLFPLDSYVKKPLTMMQVVDGDEIDASTEQAYMDVVNRYYPGTPIVARVERFMFYEWAKTAFAVVVTGETAKYANLILQKGIVAV